MKKITILLFLSFVFCSNYAQQKTAMYKTIPQEKVFVHYNTSFLLSGEQLLYKVYCVNAKNQKLTNLSKVAYVGLLDANFNVHFKHKIILNSGVGSGDFFIPASIESGNYKIIAYTKWMQNGGENNFFQGDIAILNPFADNSKFLSKEKETTNLNKAKEFEASNSNSVEIVLNKKSFTKREKVAFTINAKNNFDITGNYSISVRKKEPFYTPTKYSSISYTSIYHQNSKLSNTNDLVQIPEFRGELISGKVINSKTKEIAPFVDISISIPGKNYIFKSSKTDIKGEFYFNIDKNYKASEATLIINHKNKEDFKIILYKDVSVNYKNIVFNDFSLSEETKEILKTRSIYSQIENAYSAKKQDSILNTKNSERFFGTNLYTYYLDDYTRFPTLKETLTEITEHIYYSKRGGEYTIKILGVDFLFKDLKPLILIDGLQILNHNDIIDFNTKLVKKISVLKDNYVYGTKLYNGAVFLETYKGDYKNNISREYQKNIKLFKPLVAKKYFNQNYDDLKQERIPDFRNQLFWLQNCSLSEKINTFSCYTSDNVGDYEIYLEGFTKQGKPIFLKTTFTVK